MVPRGRGIGDATLASRQRWGLTSSLMPTAWLIQVDQTRRRAHGEPDTPGEVELCRGDSFLIIWEDDGWTLFERYPGDVAAWTTTVMPEGTEVSHHNHILLPSQRVYDGDVPPAEDPNASSSQARGHHSGGSTPHKAAPPRPPSSSTSSGNRSEKAWASEDGGDQQDGEPDRTELMQRTPRPPQGEASPSKPATHQAATAAEPRGEARHDERGQPAIPLQPRQQAPTAANPLLAPPSTQTQEEMLAVAQLVEMGQANRVEWTGRNPCQNTLEPTVPEHTLPTQMQRGQTPESPARKRSKLGASQQQPDPEPSTAPGSRTQNNTAAAQQPHPGHHLSTEPPPPQQELEQSNTATGSQQPHPEHHRATAAGSQHEGQQHQAESSAYMILRAQQLVAQLMPTLVGDQVPIAAEALGQLQAWSRGIWGHNVQLVGDSSTDTGGSQAETVPWLPPEPASRPGEQPERSRLDTGDSRQELWTPAGRQSKRKEERGHLGDCSLSSADMPGTETEDEAFGLTRRRRSAATRARRRRATTDPPEPGTETTCAGDGNSSHRRRRLHAVMSDD